MIFWGIWCQTWTNLTQPLPAPKVLAAPRWYGIHTPLESLLRGTLIDSKLTQISLLLEYMEVIVKHKSDRQIEPELVQRAAIVDDKRYQR